jgi:hypothetical protein
MQKATWEWILLLLENPGLAHYGLPARFGVPADPCQRLGQFREWPEIYRAAIALNLHKPLQGLRETVRAITQLLMEHCQSDQVKMRQLPLSDVVTLLQKYASRLTERTGPPDSSLAAMTQQKEGHAPVLSRTGSDQTRVKEKKSGGRRPLEESNPLALQVYQRIQKEHQPGERYADVVSRLKDARDLNEQIKEAGLGKLNRKLVRKALAFFAQRQSDRARKQQETEQA